MIMAVSSVKTKKVSELQELLQTHSDFVIASCSGMGVPEQNELRSQVRKREGTLRVVKNNLFYVALKNSTAHAQFSSTVEEIAKDLKGPVSVAFAGDDFSGISKALLEYAKSASGLSLKSGCLDGAYLNLNEVKELANLPSRQEMLAIIGRGLNTPATKIARGMKEVIAALARGIKAMGEKNA